MASKRLFKKQMQWICDEFTELCIFTLGTHSKMELQNIDTLVVEAYSLVRKLSNLTGKKHYKAQSGKAHFQELAQDFHKGMNELYDALEKTKK